MIVGIFLTENNPMSDQIIEMKEEHESKWMRYGGGEASRAELWEATYWKSTVWRLKITENMMTRLVLELVGKVADDCNKDGLAAFDSTFFKGPEAS